MPNETSSNAVAPISNTLMFPARVHAEIQFRGRQCSGTLCDVSLYGGLLELNDCLDELTLLRPCRLHIHPQNEAEIAVCSFNGLVVHDANGILGIKFIAMREAERLALMAFFQHHQVETRLLDRNMPDLLRQLSVSTHPLTN